MSSPHRARRSAGLVLGAVAAILALVVVLVALRADDPPAGAGTPRTQPTSGEAPSEAAGAIPDVRPDWDGKGMGPPVFLHLDDATVPLDPWTTCYGNGCADGFPQPPFHDVGERSTVPFSFPDEDWSFEATFNPTGAPDDGCRRVHTIPVRKTGRFTFEIPAAGAPGRYDVQVFGAGPEGDVVTTFRWNTTAQGQLPEPRALATVLVEDDGELTSWGVGVTLLDVARLPESASATVTVTSEEGRSVRLGPYRSRIRCPASGDVYLTGPESDGQRAAELGDGPWTYRVDLELGGDRYVGLGVWPDDHPADPFNDDPSPTLLTFDPPLPAFTG